MNEEIARKILGDDIKSDNGLYNSGSYLAWTPGDNKATLDSEFTADELEAIAWWMRNKGPGSEPDEEQIAAVLKDIYGIGRKIKEPVTVEWDEHDCFAARDSDGIVFMVGNRDVYDAIVASFGRFPKGTP